MRYICFLQSDANLWFICFFYKMPDNKLIIFITIEVVLTFVFTEHNDTEGIRLGKLFPTLLIMLVLLLSLQLYLNITDYLPENWNHEKTFICRNCLHIYYPVHFCTAIFKIFRFSQSRYGQLYPYFKKTGHWSNRQLPSANNRNIENRRKL